MKPRFFTLVLIVILMFPLGHVHSKPISQATILPPNSPAASSTRYPYEITYLGTLGGTISDAHDINESGQVVGYSYNTSGKVRAFLWESGSMSDLSTLGGTESVAIDINDSSQVVGYSYDGNGNQPAFLWESGTPMQNLGTLGGNASIAFGINNSGLIVGFAHDANQNKRATIWQNKSISDLGIGDGSEAKDVSDSGFVVGYKPHALGTDPFLWQNTVLNSDLGDLGGGIAGPEAVNRAGHVVGTSSLGISLGSHAFMWQNNSMQDLDPGVFRGSGANDINEYGQVVGYITPMGAVLWENGQIKDLDTLIDPSSGWVNLQAARGINNRGEIVGYGNYNGVYPRAFLLKPIGKVDDLSSIPGSASDAVTLTWTAPFADDIFTALAYDLRYSDVPINETTWNSATQVSGEPAPAPPGSLETFTVPSLANGTRWYFALKFQLPDSSWSSLSNVPSLLDIGFRPDMHGYNFTNYDDILNGDLSLDDMITLFNDQSAVCWNPFGPCSSRGPAEQWRIDALITTANGHCEGMSISSLRFFTGIDSPTSFQPGATSVKDLSKDNARRNIMYYFVPQMTDPVSKAERLALIAPVTTDLNNLETAFSGSNPTPMNLHVRGNEKGHAVTPFAVEQRPDDWRVWVYDNNYPNIAQTVYITTTTSSWSYLISGTEGTWSGSGIQWPSHGIGAIPISLSALPMECPWCLFSTTSNNVVHSADAQSNGNGQLWLTGGGHLMITDSQNRRLGYDGTQLFEEIPGGVANPIDGGLGQSEPIYTLPLTDTYTIQLDGQTLLQPQFASLLQYGPGYATGVRNISVAPNTLDQIEIATDGRQVVYQPSQSKAVDLLLAVDENTTQGYTFNFKGVDLTGGQPVSVTVDTANGRLVLDNLAGADGSYDLEVIRSNANGQWSFFYPGIQVLATDKHYLDYASWDGVGNMNLLIDHGGDGSIDLTVPLANTGYRLYLPLMVK